jgi:nitric oxide reductase NorD protein
MEAASQSQTQSDAAAEKHSQYQIAFSDAERKLKAYLTALWRLHPILRAATSPPGKSALRRVTFDGGYIRIPDAYSDLDEHGVEPIVRAAVAHVAAHLVFTGLRWPIGTLKPIQIALISLIEDARVEALAIREYPGLHPLWARFHTAQPHSALVAEMLMARLARALIDPEYRDDDPWVNKGRTMFFERRLEWENPAISREIGGLLGNDLGQMRIQFNAKTHVVEPAYRDDNAGLWDWKDQPPEQADESDVVVEAFRIRRTEDEQEEHQRKRNQDDSAGANVSAREKPIEEDVGVPVARYGEWDYLLGRERADWTTIVEFEPKRASTVGLDRILNEYADVENRILKLIRSARAARPIRVRRRLEGERLDLESCIRAGIDYRLGISPDPRVYETSEMRDRDLSVLVLLDISESTKEFVKGTSITVLSVERAATALLAQAMEGLGDPFAIHAFCSNGRAEVRYYRVKEFGQRYGAPAIERLAGLRGGLSTRIGAALRHAQREIELRQTHRRLVLVITDGEPSDIDVEDRKYLVEDARKAVQELAHAGIDVFCVGLDSGGDNYLARIFGRRNVVQIDRITALPEKLPALYFRLTG